MPGPHCTPESSSSNQRKSRRWPRCVCRVQVEAMCTPCMKFGLGVDDAAGLQDPVNLADHALRVAHVPEHRLGDDRVE